MKTPLSRFIVITALIFQLEAANAVEFEKLGSAIANALGTKKVSKTKATVDGESMDVYYAKDPSGKASKLAIIRKDIFQPNCTHTWVIGLDAATASIEQIRVVEMSCPHAHPAKAACFLDQYKGKGPADMKSLKGDIHTIAKATATCDFTTKAVISFDQGRELAKRKIVRNGERHPHATHSHCSAVARLRALGDIDSVHPLPDEFLDCPSYSRYRFFSGSIRW